jgi:hypothetical protein
LIASADSVVTRNDDGVIRGACDRFVGPFDCAIDTTAVFIVDLRVNAIPESVSHHQYVRLLEIDPQIAIGVTAAEIFIFDLGLCESKCFSFLIGKVGRAPMGTGSKGSA